MQTKALIILNPNSGLKQGKKYLSDILQIFCEANWSCEVYITSKSGDAKAVVEDRGSGVDVIVCVGGDGTFNEVVSGVISAGIDVSIGYIPSGSTNDFANSLKLPKNMLTAAKNIVKGSVKTFDACDFNGRTFTYVASFGAFTKASYATPQNIKNALGHLAYILGGIIEIGKIKPITLKLNVDGDVVEGDFIFGAICNSTSLGGVLTLDKNVVDMNDGLFEILLIKSPKNIAELNDCIVALTTQNYDSEMLFFKSSSSVELLLPKNVEWSLDGEYEKGSKNIKITNLRDAIKLILK